MIEKRKDAENRILRTGKIMTVCELYARQIRQHGNVKRATYISRERLMKSLERDELGSRGIDSARASDAKEWAIRMKENGAAYRTISNDKRSLKAAFYTAIQDELIRSNPFDFRLSTVLKDDTKPRQPLTPLQEERLLGFIRDDMVYRKYYNDVVILLGTGLRISELCGLTVNDVDLEDGVLRVDHQLLKNTAAGYYIETPKTRSGVRDVPMSPPVLRAFREIAKKRDRAGRFEVDGYSGFLFLRGSGKPRIGTDYYSLFRRLIRKYNKRHIDALPNTVTPHTLRHTFCTRLADAGMNPKALQYIMGHSSITMTLDYYAHATFDNAQAEMRRLTELLK